MFEADEALVMWQKESQLAQTWHVACAMAPFLQRLLSSSNTFIHLLDTVAPFLSIFWVDRYTYFVQTFSWVSQFLFLYCGPDNLEITPVSDLDTTLIFYWWSPVYFCSHCAQITVYMVYVLFVHISTLRSSRLAFNLHLCIHVRTTYKENLKLRSRLQ